MPIAMQTWRWQAASLLAMLAVSIAQRRRKKNATEQSKHRRSARRRKDLPAVIWMDPADPATLDLFYGDGGKEHAPDPSGTFTFLEEDMEREPAQV